MAATAKRAAAHPRCMLELFLRTGQGHDDRDHQHPAHGQPVWERNGKSSLANRGDDNPGGVADLAGLTSLDGLEPLRTSSHAGD